MKPKLLTIMLLVGLLAIAGCDEDQNAPSGSGSAPQPTITPKDSELPEGAADTKAVPPKTPPQSATDPDLEPVPVPAAQLPKANTQAVPDVSSMADGEAIAPQGTSKFKTPDISDTIVPYLIANQQTLNACADFSFDPDLAATGSNVHRLGENTYLVHLVCASGAYQPIQEYYLYEKTANAPNLTPLSLTYFYSDLNGEFVQQTERVISGYGDYDPAAQTVNIFTKARGLGDCGSLGFYKLDAKTKGLKLTRFLAKTECDGNYIEPIDYPQIYP